MAPWRCPLAGDASRHRVLAGVGRASIGGLGHGSGLSREALNASVSEDDSEALRSVWGDEPRDCGERVPPVGDWLESQW